MELYSVTLPDVVPIQMVTAKASYGIGFITSIVARFCDLIGIPCRMYTDKIDRAQRQATDELKYYAKRLGADGVMDVHLQIDRLSFLIYGTAYKLSAEEIARREAEEKARREAKEQARRAADAEEKAKREARKSSVSPVGVAKKNYPIIYTNPNAPYWCGACGNDGPYNGPCPKCGATIKKYNTSI